MKKFLLVLAMGCVAPIALGADASGTLWYNTLVDTNLKNDLTRYFNGEDRELPIGVIQSVKVALGAIPSNWSEKVAGLVQQFAANVATTDKIPHDADKVKNKEIDTLNKDIEAHNKKVHQRRREIKALLKSKNNPLETVGGLAALVYEYSDKPGKDNESALFWRHIVLRSNGYFKEYFLHGQKDEEKTKQVRNSFYELKTHRPKSWSSLVGLGDDYVDKRGWLSYAYGKLKYPVAIGAAALAYRNRDAIDKKIDETGLKETRVGKWVANKYTSAKDSAFGAWAGEKYNAGASRLKDFYNKVSDSTYAQKARNIGSYLSKKVGTAYEGTRNYLSNYYEQKQRERIARDPESTRKDQINVGQGSVQKLDDLGIEREVNDYMENLDARAKEQDEQSDSAVVDEKAVQNQVQQGRLQKLDDLSMAREMDDDMEKINAREEIAAEQRRLKQQEADLLWDQKREQASLKRMNWDFKNAKKDQRAQKTNRRYDKAYADRPNTKVGLTREQDYDNAYLGYSIDNEAQQEVPRVQPEPVVLPPIESPSKEGSPVPNLNEELLDTKNQIPDQKDTQLDKEKLKQDKEEDKQDREQLNEIEQKREEVKANLTQAAAEREEREDEQARNRKAVFEEKQSKDKNNLNAYLNRVKGRTNKNPLPNNYKTRGSNPYQ